MLRAAGLLAVGVLTVFSIGGVQKGCQDLRRSATTLRYPVIRDMRRSVALKPQKGLPLLADSASVPVRGLERDPGRDVLAATLVNPTAPADLSASVGRGEAEFRKICVQCHGMTMMGDGPVAALFMPPPDLLAQATRQRTDGYIYSYIRHGGIVMPSHGAQVTRAEAWDVINYLRHMQRQSPR
jgi:mono/diheme cytochrome c family protein